MKNNFNTATIGGLILGFASIFGSFALEGGEIDALILLPPIIIVFGGTFAATLIGTSTEKFSTLLHLLKLVFLNQRYDTSKTIEELVRFSTIARRDGLLALEKEIDSMNVPFIKKLLRFIIDGADPHMLRQVAEAELHSISDRHDEGAKIFQKMGGYSPTMGIIGTVMGLIATLAAAGEDPNQLIRHIASAFIATLWGVLMANLVWLPIADKLRHIHNEEFFQMQLAVEGVSSIQAGEIPSVIRAKLISMLPTKLQTELL